MARVVPGVVESAHAQTRLFTSPDITLARVHRSDGRPIRPNRGHQALDGSEKPFMNGWRRSR
jgi:hypothetical protein